jgi:hypothetical protein
MMKQRKKVVCRGRGKSGGKMGKSTGIGKHAYISRVHVFPILT